MNEQEALSRLRWIAHLLDDQLCIPGTSIRFGLDPLLGLLPGLGDVLGLGLSSYVVWMGWRLGVPRATVLRMILNVVVDMVLGAVPVAGDLFDFFYKANVKNVQLIVEHLGVRPLDDAPEDGVRVSPQG